MWVRSLGWDEPLEEEMATHFNIQTPILWPPHAKSWLIGKDSEAGKDCGQEEKEMTEGETQAKDTRMAQPRDYAAIVAQPGDNNAVRRAQPGDDVAREAQRRQPCG